MVLCSIWYGITAGPLFSPLPFLSCYFPHRIFLFVNLLGRVARLLRSNPVMFRSLFNCSFSQVRGSHMVLDCDNVPVVIAGG